MIFLALWAIALALALTHVSIARLWPYPLERATIFLLYQMTVALGVVGFLAFAGHVLRPAEIAARRQDPETAELEARRRFRYGVHGGQL
jgi:hypothetical protein